MPNLFPTEEVQAQPETVETASEVSFGKSWRFDFDKGEFVLTPAGKVAETSDVDAWLEWCRKALMTARYQHLIYSRNYGQEFDDLISRHLNREGNESEIKRIVTETLMVDPRTVAVENFTFQWEGDTVYFTCEVSNVRGETETLHGSVVI
ncbi:DUF2634 domain-containing protein [Biomaibacter acetigenes]|uniref:DUF2634 domain-containing protein n=1 Tax=Biomaibacter acetigenes TaxID=2316383 RepID=A0A3G2R6S4_9FIRM|nr:DUF2634 domain-containing protein [Biomaibacter acetigenes]AYO30798.1 DUF2634 domain-containing protein [Biomaibacter acetigenes]